MVGLVGSAREPTENIDKYFIPTELTELLQSVDYLVNILPATPETDNILGRCKIQLQYVYYSESITVAF